MLRATKSSTLQQHGTMFDIRRPGKPISSKCPLRLCVTRGNLPNQFLLLTVIQVSSFGVVTSSYLDSTTWPSRRCSRSLRTSELSSTAATVYANLCGERRNEKSMFYTFVIVAMNWQHFSQNSYCNVPYCIKKHFEHYHKITVKSSCSKEYWVKCWKYSANIHLSSGQARFPEKPNSEKLFITVSSVNRSGLNLHRKRHDHEKCFCLYIYTHIYIQYKMGFSASW